MSEIVFANETYLEIVDEIKPMLPLHWQELAFHKDIPLDPDYSFYEKAGATGLLLFMTARKDGALIGYSIWIVKPHPHYQRHTWALNDIVWLHPDYRRMTIGRQFVEFWEQEFKNRGVAVIHVDTKIVAPQLLYLLENNGYAETSIGVEKRI